MFEIYDYLPQVIQVFECREREIEKLGDMIAREDEQLAQHRVSVTDMKNRSDKWIIACCYWPTICNNVVTVCCDLLHNT